VSELINGAACSGVSCATWLLGKAEAISMGSFLVKSSASFWAVSMLTVVLFWLIWVTREASVSICSFSKPLAANWANVLSVVVKAFSTAFSGLSLSTLMMLSSSAWRAGSNLAI